jgi:putative MFS transporter
VNLTPGIAERMDRLPVAPLHIIAVALCALGLLFDVAELAVNAAFSAVKAGDPDLALLLASVFFGGAVGAPVLGWLADRFGRRTTLQLSMLLVALPSLGAAFSPDDGWLIFFRVLSGMALGAYPPLMTAYLADVLPPKRRATLILFGDGFGLLGGPAVIFLIWWLTPIMPMGIEGWRWALIVGGACSGLVGLAFLLMPESPRWLAVRGRMAEAEAACRAFERSAGVVTEGTSPAITAPPNPELAERMGRYWPNLVLVSAIYLMRPWPTVGFPVLLGALLVARGWNISSSLMAVGIAGFGAAAGAMLSSLVIDKVERRTALTVVTVLMLMAGAAFAATEDAMVIYVSGTAFNLLGASYGPMLSIYASELFPTALRARSTATAWAANRIGSAIAPIILLPILGTYGVMLVLATICATLLVNLALILVFGPRGLAGRPLAA